MKKILLAISSSVLLLLPQASVAKTACFTTEMITQGTGLHGAPWLLFGGVPAPEPIWMVLRGTDVFVFEFDYEFKCATGRVTEMSIKQFTQVTNGRYI